MRQVYLVSALLLCHLVSAERDADCSSKLTPEAEMKCKRAKRKASSLTSQSLSTRINSDVLRHIMTVENEKKVAEFQGVAMETVLAAIQLFTVKNQSAHNITQGISKMAEGLWTCIMFFIPEDTQQTETFQWFNKAWTSTFSTLRGVQAAEIEGRIQAFNENGQGFEIAHVVYMCVDSSVDLVKRFVNNTVAAKIVPWFEGVRSVTEGVAKSWEAIANGEPEKAAQAVYFSIRQASEAVLPDSVKSHTAYGYITGILDEQIGNLNRYVMGFKKTLAESTICIRQNIYRNSSGASACPPWDDYVFFSGCCIKKSALLQTDGGGAFIQEWESGAREELLHVKSRAACEINAGCAHHEQCPLDAEMQRCLAHCPRGFSEPKSKSFCWQDCPEDFPHHMDGKKKCARSETAWDELNMDKMAKAAKGIVSLVNVVFAFVDRDDEKVIKSLNNVFNSGFEFAQTFSFANCAMPEVLPSIEC